MAGALSTKARSRNVPSVPRHGAIRRATQLASTIIKNLKECEIASETAGIEKLLQATEQLSRSLGLSLRARVMYSVKVALSRSKLDSTSTSAQSARIFRGVPRHIASHTEIQKKGRILPNTGSAFCSP
jgi:hypothetical protein